MTPAVLIAGIPWWIWLAAAAWGAFWSIWLYRLDRRDRERTIPEARAGRAGTPECAPSVDPPEGEGANAPPGDQRRRWDRPPGHPLVVRDRELGTARGDVLALLVFVAPTLVCGIGIGASCATDDDVRDALELGRCR